MKKVYFVEIVKDGETLDVASTQADNYEGAAKIIDAAAAGRGFTGFNLREVTEEYFIAFKNQKQEEAAIAEAAAQPVTQPGLEAAAGEQGNPDSAQSGAAENTGEATPPAAEGDAPADAGAQPEEQPAADPAPAAEDNSESLAGDSQGVPVTEGADAAQENPEKSAEAQAEAGDKAAAAA